MKVRGPQFLSILHENIERHEKDILGERLKFTLNPTCFHYLNEKLTEFEEVGRRAALIHQSEQIDRYEKIMNTLKNFVREVPFLRICPDDENIVDSETPLDLRRYKSLRKIELIRVRGYLLDNVSSKKLVALTATRSLQSLAEILQFSCEDQDSASEQKEECWYENLEIVSFADNVISSMDESLSHLIKVRRLDLSRNLIQSIANLQECVFLEHLNLSRNRIENLTNLHLVLGNVAVLILSENRISCTSGLEKMFSLQHLDLGYNLISRMEEINRLGSLPQLREMILLGNPLSEEPSYRLEVVSAFTVGTLLTLDSTSLDSNEVSMMKPDLSNELDRLKTLPTPQRSGSTSRGSSVSLAIPASAGSQRGTRGSAKTRRGKKSVAQIEALDSGSDGDEEDTVAEPKSLPRTALSERANDPTFARMMALKERAESLRSEDGNKWLVVFNHMLDQETPEEKKKRTEEEQFKLQMALAKSRVQIRTAKLQQTAKDVKEDIRRASMVMRKDADGSTVESREPTLTLGSVSKGSDNTLDTSLAKDVPISPEVVSNTSAESSVSAAIVDEPQRPMPSTLPKAVLEAMERDRRIEQIIVQIRNATAEFIVKLLDSSEERILLVSSTHIVEADPECRFTVSHESKYLDSVEYWGQRGGFPVVKVVFAPPRADGEGRNDKLVTIGYIMADEAAKDELIKTLSVIASSNSRSKLICLHCSQVFLRPSGGLEKCPECGHDQLIIFEGRNADSSGTSTEVANDPLGILGTNAPANKNAARRTVAFGASSPSMGSKTGGGFSDSSASTNNSTSSGVQRHPSGPEEGGAGGEGVGYLTTDEDERGTEDAAPDTMDVNLQLYFRLNHFCGIPPPGESEQFVYFFKSDFIRFGSKMEYIVPSHILLSNINLYLLMRTKKPTEKDPGFKLLHVIPLNELRRVVIGPNYQYFRFEHLRKGFVYLTRDHRRTHRFINLLRSTLASRSVAEFMSSVPLIVEPLNNDVLSKRGTMVLRKGNGNYLHAYFLVFHYSQAAAASGLSGLLAPLTSTLSSNNSTSSCQLRTFILTNHHLLLLSENLAKWPNMEGQKHPGVPWFELVDMRQLSDVVAVEMHSENRFDIVFEDESDSSGQPKRWSLRAETQFQRQKLVGVLSQMWRSLFKLPISVVFAE